MTMEILEYAKVDPNQVLAINLFGLGYPFTPARAARTIAAETRLAPFVALYAADEGQVLGQVGVMRATLETKDGPEVFGALWAVSTRPDQTGKGIATRLVEEAHRRMRRWGLRYSYLTTSRATVAHHVYQKVGYRDLVALDQALAPARSGQGARARGKDAAGSESVAGPPWRAVPAGESEGNALYELYTRAVSGRLGFTHRAPNFVDALTAAGDLSWSDVLLLKEGARSVGYGLSRAGAECVWVNEVTVVPGHDLTRALKALREAFADRAIVCRGVHSAATRAALDRAGFTFRTSGPGVLMVADLTRSADDPADLASLKDRLGIDEGLFVFGGPDST